MPRSSPPLGAALALFALATASPAAAQIGRAGVTPAAPSAYAITNARIVPVASAPIEKGTVVVRNGLVQAVGAGVAVPADARLIDGAGLTIYPGFVDAYTSLGLPGAQQPSGGGRGAGGGGPAAAFAQQQGAGNAPTGAPNSRYPVGLQPELRALDLVRIDGDPFDAARGVGLTSALVVPRDGIFMGQSALIELAGSDAQDVVLRSPVALHVGFTPLRGGGYPGSLLGVFSSLRQMLLDAQRYGETQAAYARNPRGMARPETDQSLAALQPVLRGEMPVVMLAGTQREIERALDLAAEFKLRVVIAGGAEAYAVADRLKAQNVAVIATLNFPRRPQNQSADADPEPLRVLRERVEAPRNAARLAERGVKFAFTSGGMASLADFLPNLRRSVDGGLSKDRALRALTLDAADVLGVSDRLGSIEAGKIANLTIVRGDLFDANARVTQVFVDGRPYEVRAPQPASGGQRGGMASGTWTLNVALEGQEKQVTLNLFQEADRLRGGIQGALGSASINNGSIGADGALKFTASVTLPDGTEEATFEGTITGNDIRGTVQMVGKPQGTFAGSRPEGQRTPGRPAGAPRQQPPQE